MRPQAVATIIWLTGFLLAHMTAAVPASAARASHASLAAEAIAVTPQRDGVVARNPAAPAEHAEASGDLPECDGTAPDGVASDEAPSLAAFAGPLSSRATRQYSVMFEACGPPRVDLLI